VHQVIFQDFQSHLIAKHEEYFRRVCITPSPPHLVRLYTNTVGYSRLTCFKSVFVCRKEWSK